jgi:hypothetical protein
MGYNVTFSLLSHDKYRCQESLHDMSNGNYVLRECSIIRIIAGGQLPVMVAFPIKSCTYSPPRV